MTPWGEDGVGLIVSSYGEAEAHRVDTGPRPDWNRSWTVGLRRPQDQPCSLWDTMGPSSLQPTLRAPQMCTNVGKTNRNMIQNGLGVRTALGNKKGTGGTTLAVQ